MNKLRFLPFVLLSFLAGCVCRPSSDTPTFSKPGTGETADIGRAALVGTWYGNQPTLDGTVKEWICRRETDGSFQIHFREIVAGRVVSDSIEAGEWGLSYDLEVMVTRGWIRDGHFRPAPNNAFFWDIYRIEKLDTDTMTYLHQGTGHRYHVRRVADDFQFPPTSGSPAAREDEVPSLPQDHPTPDFPAPSKVP